MSEKKKIGFSLSKCIQDIVEGEVAIEQVSMIVTGTNAKTKEDWRKILGSYLRVYWRKYPLRALRIFFQLKNSGRITQPRTEGGEGPSVADKIFWRDDKK